MEKDCESPKKTIQVIFNEDKNSNFAIKPKSILRKQSRFSKADIPTQVNILSVGLSKSQVVKYHKEIVGEYVSSEDEEAKPDVVKIEMPGTLLGDVKLEDVN